MIDINDVYFILGVVLTFITTYFGIWYSNKNKTKNQLSLIDQNWMSLIDTFEDNFKILKLEDYKLPVNTNLYYYKGVIINTGNTDIDKSKIYKPLTISFPNDVKITELRTNYEASEKIGIKVNQTENSLSFNWDLMKPYEYFSFDIIIESAKAYDSNIFHKGLVLDHRISDLKTINRIDTWDVKNSTKKIPFLKNLFMYGVFLFIVLFGSAICYVGINSFYKPFVEIKYYPYSNDDNKLVKYEYFDEDNLKVSHGNKTDIIPYNSFNQKVRPVPQIIVNRNQYFLVIVGFFGTIAMLFGLRKIILEHYNEYKISKIMRSLN